MADKLREILLFPMLLLILCLVVTISLVMFEAASSENYVSATFSARLSLLIAISAEIFMFSFRGEVFKRESLMIGDRIYYSNWYQLRFSKPNRSNMRILRQFRTMVQLTILRSSRPFRLSAGGFATMSYRTSLTVNSTNY